MGRCAWPSRDPTERFAERTPFSVAAWALIFLLGFMAVTIVGTAVEAASYLTLGHRHRPDRELRHPQTRPASRNEGISGRTLAIDALVFLLGSLARYLIIETVYSGFLGRPGVLWRRPHAVRAVPHPRTSPA